MSGRRTYKKQTTAVEEGTAEEEQQQQGAWCVKRSGWFYGLAGGIILVFHATAAAALAAGVIAYIHARYSLVQTNHYQDGRMDSSPLAHVLLGTTPLVLTLPKDLTPYIGRVYHVDCGSAAAHTVVIEPGSSATTWTAGTPNVRTATCLASGGGFSFRVISATGIRLIDPQLVSFT